jgi:hypothetical protein
MKGIRETEGGPGGCEPAGGMCVAEEDEDGEVELKTGFGWRWKGSRMFKNAERAWTGTLCWAWSRKYRWQLW